MDFIGNSWHGSEKLWRVFWIYGIGPALFLALLGVYAIHNNLAILKFVLAAVNIVYLIWFYVSAWKCAFNCSWNGWGYIVRFFVVLNVFYFIVAPFLNKN